MESAQECLQLQQQPKEFSSLDLIGGAYMRTSSPIMIANHDSFAPHLTTSDLIYNLSDVEKFLPKLTTEDINDWSVETVTRKRKERLDSGSSSLQERKVVRSNSEERSVTEDHGEDAIRRISSHEDFEQKKKTSVPPPPPPLHEQNYESFYIKDDKATSAIGEKYSHIFGIDNEHTSTDFFCHRQKYSKNDCSPSRSRIHEYILFPKRISPNRDPGVGSRGSWENFHVDERDHERARCSERRSRTLAPRTRRGPARRQAKSKENELVLLVGNNSSFVCKDALLPHSSKKCETVSLCGEKHPKQNLESSERPQSPAVPSVSPIKKTPVIDLTTLHEQLGQNEPVPSVPTKLMGFPWDPETCHSFEPVRDENITIYDKKDISNIRDQRRTLPDKCDVKNAEEASKLEPDERLKKINKRIQLLKKMLAKSEEEFEAHHGYKVSQNDKLTYKGLSSICAEIKFLKTEKKSIKAMSESLSRPVPTQNTSGESMKNKNITEIIAEIEKRLESKRASHGRPYKLEDCTYMQLTDEKVALQRALLWLEGARGRPTNKEDRDAVRSLYDRYRAVKRLVARYDAIKANSSIGELETIMEHETMLFTNLDSPVESPEANEKPSHSDSGTSISEKKDSEDPTSSSAKSTTSDDTYAITETISNENLHCLPLKELNKLLVEVKNLKISLRRNIKLFEAEFEVQNGRKLLKDEKQAILPSYEKYKETKARLRLLNALINKQKKAYG